MGRIGSFCRLLFGLYFAFFYQSFLFGTDAFEEHGCGLIVGVLGYELAVDGEVEYLLT